jgi:hypothetical protein
VTAVTAGGNAPRRIFRDSPNGGLEVWEHL